MGSRVAAGASSGSREVLARFAGREGAGDLAPVEHTDHGEKTLEFAESPRARLCSTHRVTSGIRSRRAERGEILDGQPFEAWGQAPALRKPAHSTLDDVAAPIRGARSAWACLEDEIGSVGRREVRGNAF